MKKLILLITVAALLASASARATPKPPARLARVLHHTFGRGRDYRVAVCVAWRESRFKQRAVSASGDYGLMQINHAAHPQFSTRLLLSSAAYNARAARIVRRSSGWRAWTTYRDGCWRVA